MASERLDIIVALRNAASAGLLSVKKGLTGITVASTASTASLGGMYKKLLAIGALFAGGRFLGSSLQTFVGFDDAMRAAGAVTKATTKELEDMTKVAKKMGKTTRFTASEAAGGLKLLGMAGFEASEAIEALPGVLNLAAAGTVGLSEAADIATNILAAFGLEVENLAQVNDVLVQTATSSNTTVLELGEAFKDIGAIAKGVGGNFEDIFAAIGKLGDAAFKGTRAGTALKGSIQALLAPTRQEMDLMAGLTDRLGGVALKVKDSSGRFIGFVEIIRQLEKAGIKGDEALQIFGLRAGPGMQALVNQGVESLEKLKEKLDDSTDVAKTVAEQMEAGIGGATRRMTAAFEGLRIKILETFGQETINLIEAVNKKINQFTNALDDVNKKKSIEILKWEVKSLFKLLGRFFEFAWNGFIIFEKSIVGVILAISGNLKAAGEAFKDIEGDMLNALQRLGVAETNEKKLKILLLDEEIDKIKTLIKSSENLADQAEKDLDSWKAKIVGTEVYQKQLNKHLKTLSELSVKLKTLQDKRNIITLEIEVDEKTMAAKVLADKNKSKPDANPIGSGDDGGDFDIVKTLTSIKVETKLKAGLIKIRAIIKNELILIQEEYNQGRISLENYYDERAVIIRKAIEAELAILERKRYTESDPDKNLLLDASIVAKKQQLETELLKLKFEFARKEKDIADKKLDDENRVNALRIKAEKAFQDQKNRVNLDPAYGLLGEHQKELADLQTRQNQELEVIKDFYKEKLELLKENKASEKEINEAGKVQAQVENDLKILQESERAKLILDQQERLVSAQLGHMSDAAGNMATILGAAYELSGKKSKELFIASKAFAIAQATIKTYESATSIYASLATGGPWAAVLASAGAAAAIAAGMANVAAIKGQNLAEGGAVKGYSPHSKADNIPINATADEFVQPVATTKYFGMDAMEKIRTRSVSRESLRAALGLGGIKKGSFSMPPIRYNTNNFAEGGAVKRGVEQAQKQNEGLESINVYNIMEDTLLEQWGSSASGDKTFINQMGRNAYEVKQMLLAEG